MLALKPNPTFLAKVRVPIPGGPDETIELEFKHMSAQQFELFLRGQAAKDRSDLDTVMGVVVGWSGVDGDFTRENVDAVLQGYQGAARAIVGTWARELAGLNINEPAAAGNN